MQLRFSIALSTFCRAQIVVISIVLLLGIAAYAFANLTGYGRLLGFLHLLDVDNEQSLPTYVSILNLLLAAMLLLVIYAYEKSAEQKGAAYWLFLSGLFLFLSFDESAGVHEKFGNVYILLVDKGVIPPLLTAHEWLPFGILFVVVALTVFVPFLRGLRPDTRRYFLIAGGVFVGGAVGTEMIQSYLFETGVIAGVEGDDYQIGPLFEEGLEMIGIVIFNCALYREILKRDISLAFR